MFNARNVSPFPYYVYKHIIYIIYDIYIYVYIKEQSNIGYGKINLQL